MFKNSYFALLVLALSGCNTGETAEPTGTGNQAPGAPAAASKNALPTSVHIGDVTRVVLRPSRLHDFTRADGRGTLQFQIAQGSTETVTQSLSGSAVYVSDAGKRVDANIEVPPVKGDSQAIAVVQAARDLEEDTWYTLRVEPGNKFHVEGRDAGEAWSVRLFTGSDPRLVGVERTAEGVELIMSEPVNWAKLETSLSSATGKLDACIETGAGCVEQPSADLLDERALLRTTAAQAASDLVVTLRSRASAKLLVNPAFASVKLRAADFKLDPASGKGAWLRKSGE